MEDRDEHDEIQMTLEMVSNPENSMFLIQAVLSASPVPLELKLDVLGRHITCTVMFILAISFTSPRHGYNCRFSIV